MNELKTPRDIASFIQKEQIEVVDLRFMDFPGLWQHFSVPAREMKEETFEKGLGFDGSSIRGWQAINESDMLVKPDPETAFIDPFFAAKTLVILCNISATRSPARIIRATRAISPARPKNTSSILALPIPLISARKLNSSFSTAPGSTRTNTKAISILIQKKANGTAAGRKIPTWRIKSGTRKVIFPCPRRTACRIFAVQ